jgi:hypothetical protein
MQPLVSSLSAGDCLVFFIISDGCIIFIQFYFDLFLLMYLAYLFSIANLDGWLIVHRSITLVDFQLDAHQDSQEFNFKLSSLTIYKLALRT